MGKDQKTKLDQFGQIENRQLTGGILGNFGQEIWDILRTKIEHFSKDWARVQSFGCSNSNAIMSKIETKISQNEPIPVHWSNVKKYGQNANPAEITSLNSFENLWLKNGAINFLKSS